MRTALRVAESQYLVGRRHWRRTALLALGPVTYLLAVGVGLGTLIDTATLGTSNYLRFLAPGLLAATAMQTAANANAWPVFGASRDESTYQLMITAPIRIRDLVLGQFVWTIGRLVVVLVPLYVVMIALRALQGVSGMLALPVAVLTGAAFGPAAAALAVSLRRGTGISVLLSLVISPLFLLSGAFFPIDQLPDGWQAVARWTPLYHGVELSREAVTDDLELVNAAIHVGVLVAFVLAGLVAADRALSRRLER